MRTDFTEISSYHNVFIKNFNALKYIEENPYAHLMNPQQFVAEYQIEIDAYLQNQSLNCQRLLLNKRYMFFILLNKERFYQLYEDKYTRFFHNLDIVFAQQSKIIQQKVMEAIKHFSAKETH
jgi:hypothetical protein